MTRITLLFLSMLLLISASSVSAKKTEKHYDAIIIPGYPYNPDGKMNAIYRLRLGWAFELYRSGRCDYIIVSGSAVHSPYVEAEIFALYLMEAGIPAEALILERNAEHSMENVFYAMDISKELGFEDVAVATDMWQAGMIQMIGKIHNHDLSDVDFLPAKFSIVNRLWRSFEFEIDHQLAHRSNFTPLMERKDKEQRSVGTHGHSWTPLACIELSMATELKNQ